MHRYGRHGAKAWVHWRNKHFRKAHLVPSPRVAVFNVPLEFLSQIQKVVIFMQDGSRLEVEKNVSQAQLNGHSALSAEERYLDHASNFAIFRAKKDYATLADPYTLHNQSEIDYEASKIYIDMQATGAQFTAWSTSEDAAVDYIDRFNTVHSNRLDELSGATTPATRELIIAAASDRDSYGSTSPEDFYRIRAIIRAYQSLAADGQALKKLPDETIFLVQEHTRLYHRRYNQHRSDPEVTSKEGD